MGDTKNDSATCLSTYTIKDNSGNVLLTLGGGATPTYNLGPALTLTPALNTVNLTTVQVTNQGQASFYSIPDAGANADFVMTAGTQTVGGQKTFSTGITMADNKNIALGATTGTTIGTNNTQKLGFYGKTPVIQAISSAGFTNATGTADNLVITNNIITALRNLGLVAVA